jgi:NAD-dependent dihydropyrimidine dehydrogenase PreA subunit
MNVYWNHITDENYREEIEFLLRKQLEGDRQTSKLHGKKIGFLLNLASVPSAKHLLHLETLLQILVNYFHKSEHFVLADNFYPSCDTLLKSYIPDTRYMQHEHFSTLPKKRPTLQFTFFGGTKSSSYLSGRYISNSIAEADYLLSITFLEEDPIFSLHGSTSSNFWFLPTYTKNEILIQENLQGRCLSLLEATAPFISNIHCFVNIFSSPSDSFMVLSQNTISADAVSGSLCNIPSSKNKLIGLADKKGFGTSVLSHMTIYGDRIKKPIVFFENGGENYSLGIRKDQCSLCEDCVVFCPLHAIYIQNQHLFWDSKKCNRCGYCISICSQSALFKRRK